MIKSGISDNADLNYLDYREKIDFNNFWFKFGI